MFTGRAIKNEFGEEFIGCIENDTDGIYSIFLRFELYLEDIDTHIKEANNQIKKELDNEVKEIRYSLSQGPDIDNSLNYFSDLLYKSTFVSLYSFIEFKLSEIARICEKHIPKINVSTL